MALPRESAAIELLTPSQVEAYLARIGHAGSRAVALDTLTALHRAHLLAVPFENLDIHLGRHIDLAVPRFYEKLMHQRRGGFCYELNGAFASLLASLGFDVTMLSARVAMPDGSFTPPFDHMTLHVVLDDADILADVGFGDSFVEPLVLTPGIEQPQADRTFRLTDEGDTLLLEERDGDGWSRMFRFDLTPHTLDEYVPRCEYLQTAPESMFVTRRICSRATPAGRITISDGRLIVTERDHRAETTLEGEAAVRRALEDHFSIRI